MSEQYLARWHWLMACRNLYDSYQQCLALSRPGDGLLFMGKHIYLLVDDRLQPPPEDISLFGLAEDLQMTGLSGKVPPYVQVVDWAEVLSLLEREYPLQQTWV